MIRATEADLSLSCTGMADWRQLYVAHPNVLLEGPEAATDSALLQLKPLLPGPVISKRRGVPLALPTGEVGALILEDVSGLSAEEQRALFEWIDATKGRTQIVSMTAHPLFPLIQGGLFDAALYYRLNVLLLQVDSSVILSLYTHGAEADRSRTVSSLQLHPLADQGERAAG